MDAILKRLKSKTYWFAGVLIGSGILDAQTGAISSAVQTYIPVQWHWAVAPVIGLIVAGLREWTSKPLADK
jgi:hypothetical protein